MLNINIQLDCLIEIQSNILNIIRQRVNFSLVFIKQFDSNKFESKLKVNIVDKKSDLDWQYGRSSRLALDSNPLLARMEKP